MTRTPAPPIRLDIALARRGLAATRSRAQDLIRRGQVRVHGAIVSRPGRLVHEGDAIAVASGSDRYVSRGALKLVAGLDAFGFSPVGLTALDIGASTGGFTQVLLERGAARVHAVDVGHGQLHPRLAADPRVVVHEASDARALDRRAIPEPINAVTADVSFISLTLVLPAALALAGEEAWLVALIKPQFEAGRAAVGKGGIVRGEADRQAAVERVRCWLSGRAGWRIEGVVESPIAGGAGNREFLLGARHGR